jgi:hypothetical protein
VHSKRKCAYSELTACAWLLKQGYDVFRNVSDRGCIDIVAWKGTKFYYFDVKSAGENCVNRRWPLTREQIELGVIPLLVLPNGECQLCESRPSWKPKLYLPSDASERKETPDSTNRLDTLADSFGPLFR